MADIRLHNKAITVTQVPNRFIDEYMTNANGEYVKVYLYLLRCMGHPGSDLSISTIADHLEFTERDVNRALHYWEKQQLLQLVYDADHSLSSIYLADLMMSSAPQAPSSSFQLNAAASLHTTSPEPALRQASASTQPAAPARREYSVDELTAFQEHDEIQELIFITSQYLNRQISQTELRSIFFWYDSLHFSVELIEYLIEYCVGKGHTSIHYMEKVAIAWAENKITTVELAKKESACHNKDVYTVMRAFGINNRNLVDYERDFIKKWAQEFGFTSDIISEACRRTLQATQKASFEYADTILASWHKNQVHHLEDIVKLDSAFQKSRKTSGQAQQNLNSNTKNKFNNYPERSYDYDELERQLLQS